MTIFRKGNGNQRQNQNMATHYVANNILKPEFGFNVNPNKLIVTPGRIEAENDVYWVRAYTAAKAFVDTPNDSTGHNNLWDRSGSKVFMVRQIEMYQENRLITYYLDNIAVLKPYQEGCIVEFRYVEQYCLATWVDQTSLGLKYWPKKPKVA